MCVCMYGSNQDQSGMCVAAGEMGMLQQVVLLMAILYHHDVATATPEQVAYMALTTPCCATYRSWRKL